MLEIKENVQNVEEFNQLYYEVAEISYYELKVANKEIVDWIDQNITYQY